MVERCVDRKLSACASRQLRENDGLRGKYKHRPQRGGAPPTQRRDYAVDDGAGVAHILFDSGVNRTGPVPVHCAGCSSNGCNSDGTGA